MAGKTIAEYQADWTAANEKYNAATTQAEKDAAQQAMSSAHEGAQNLRKAAGYDGGEWGNANVEADRAVDAGITKSNEQEASVNKRIDDLQSQLDSYQTQSKTSTANDTSSSQLAAIQAQLEDWNTNQVNSINAQLEALQKKTDEQNEYATQQKVAELQRTYEDAINTYNQERAKNAYSANQAKDNMALYNAKVGDKGGIGSKLYSDQQSSYDAQMLNIDLQQAQLKTDIERQVADAIAEGDYAKAQTAYEIGIQKMQALSEQANTLLNTQMSLASGLDTYGFNKASQDLNQTSQDRSYFMNLLNMGIFDEQAAIALGVPADQAKDYADNINKMNQIDSRLAQAQLDATLKEVYGTKEEEPTNTDKLGLSTTQWKLLGTAANADSLVITRGGKQVTLGYNEDGSNFEDINTGEEGFREGDIIDFGNGVTREFRNDKFVDPSLDAGNPIDTTESSGGAWVAEVGTAFPSAVGRTPAETYNKLVASYNEWMSNNYQYAETGNKYKIQYDLYKNENTPTALKATEPYRTYLETKNKYETLISQYKQ